MQLVCAQCLAKNRVPDQRLRDRPKCGKCGAALLSPEPVALGDAAFDAFVAGAGLPVLVDFWAEWCGPCKMMAPQFAAAAQQRPDIRFVKVDTEAARATAARFGIRSIPTLALFVGGSEVARVAGAMSSAQLLAWVDQQLGAR
jgi:thioredoxin 2